MYDHLTDMMAGDPYNEDRFIDVKVDIHSDVVKVVVGENNFSSLDLNLKATAYEGISRDIQQEYKELRKYDSETITVTLFDSNRNELSSFH